MKNELIKDVSNQLKGILNLVSLNPNDKAYELIMQPIFNVNYHNALPRWSETENSFTLILDNKEINKENIVKIELDKSTNTASIWYKEIVADAKRNFYGEGIKSFEGIEIKDTNEIINTIKSRFNEERVFGDKVSSFKTIK